MTDSVIGLRWGEPSPDHGPNHARGRKGNLTLKVAGANETFVSAAQIGSECETTLVLACVQCVCIP